MPLVFYYNEFKSGKGRHYSSMYSLRSAISTVAIIDGRPADQHLVCGSVKTVFHLKPTLSCYNLTWDPQVLLKYLVDLGPNKRLSILQLSWKLVMLMLLQIGQCGQTLLSLDVRNLDFTPWKGTFTLGDTLKTSGLRNFFVNYFYILRPG